MIHYTKFDGTFDFNGKVALITGGSSVEKVKQISYYENKTGKSDK
jgi:hypothetical protein